MPLVRWWIPAISLLSFLSRDAGAICREVTEKGSAPPAITPDQELLVIKRTGVPVGCERPPDPDGGAPDGGMPPLADAAPGDGGAPAADSGPGDAGSPADAAPGDAAPADAANGGPCQPHIGDTVTWIVQPRFTIGPDGSRFALLMVTPAAPVVETAPASTFLDLAATTAPREIIQERYIEDRKLGYQCDDPKFGGTGGCGGSFDTPAGGTWEPPDPSGQGAADAGTPDGYIRVNTVGSYHVAILSVRDGDELADWLDRAEYNHDDDDIAALRPYLEAGWIVTAVRISSDHAVESGGLEPLSFTFEGDDMRLPLGVARQPEGGRALLKVHVAAEGRYEFPGAAVSYAHWVRDERPTFLTASFLDVDLSRGADADPVAARTGFDTFHEEYTITREIRIPSSDCPRGDDDDDDLSLCDCRVGGNPGSQVGMLLMAAVCAAVVLRRRRR
jgi:MYXO-CTERM domain-containing protein